MVESHEVVVIGASTAGVSVVNALRAQGFDGKVTLVGSERHAPYYRPALSKEFLVDGGQLADDDIVEHQGNSYVYADPAVGLDPAASRILLRSGRDISYKQLVICTGAVARQPWGDAPAGMLTLRELDDALTLQCRLKTADTIAVIGGGFLGLEVASAAVALGIKVTLIEAESMPLARMMGSKVAAVLQPIFETAGVRILANTTVTTIHGSRELQSLELSDGSCVEASLALVAVGVAPNVEWLYGSGLPLGPRGLACDAEGRVLGANNIWASGDVADWRRTDGRRQTSKHWMPARTQGSLVAGSVCGSNSSLLQHVDYAWSDMFGIRISLIGSLEQYDQVDVLGRALLESVALYFAAGVLVGAVVVNQPLLVIRLRAILSAGYDITHDDEKLSAVLT